METLIPYLIIYLILTGLLFVAVGFDNARKGDHGLYPSEIITIVLWPFWLPLAVCYFAGKWIADNV